MLSKLKMQLGVLWSTRMKMEILDSAQDLEFLSLAVLLAANLFKGIIYPTSWSIQKDHISYIHYASWLKDHSEEFCTWGLDWLSIRLWRLLNSTNKHHQHHSKTTIANCSQFPESCFIYNFCSPEYLCSIFWKLVTRGQTNKTFFLATIDALVLCRISTFLGYNHNQPSSLSMWNMFW